MFAKEEGPKGKDSGWWDCHLVYSVRRSKVLECCRYGGRTTALSLASRGSCTLRSQASKVTKVKSKFCEIKNSCAKESKRLMASRKEPAVRTCSQVRVVRLAEAKGQYPSKAFRCYNENGVSVRPLEQRKKVDILHRGVIGVLTGLTSTLSR